MNDRPKPRRSVQHRNFLGVTLCEPGGRTLEGWVVELSADGAGAIFDEPGTDAFESGTEVDLVLHALVLLQPIRAGAIVRRRTVERGITRYDFDFKDPEEVDHQIPFVLRNEFNRRNAPRIDLDEPTVVVLDIENHHSAVRGILHDVSAQGMGIHLDPNTRLSVGVGEHVEAAFSLPGCPNAFHLQGVIRNLQKFSDLTILGIEFDQDTPSVHLSVLEEWVSERVSSVTRARRS